ncbi:MAG TPA: NYN domain-containing protein, partial [Candidatus Pacearchaeota archaeon]|nr:NYN domain-containing protein [Candidatus Pacearchaeota archaeon]
MEDTLVFIDEGFLSKLSKYFGNGAYIKIDYLKLAKNLAKKQNLSCKHLFYYTAPPFQGTPPADDEKTRKEGYDKFIIALSKNKEITVREGRCQKIINNIGQVDYKQKGVDALMVSDMVSVPIRYPKIKKIILVT